MKNPTYFQITNQNFIIVLFAVMAFFGMSLNAQAQSPVLGYDMEKVNNSMKIQMNNQEFDVLIPKVNKNELSAFVEANYNQVVYVTNEDPGFYMYSHNQWTKQNVRSVLAEIELNIHMSAPSSEDIIIEASVANSKQRLDYNSYIEQLYKGFIFEEGSNQMAVVIR
ncbi:hypothetical protein JKA74_03925 [Marivirga sp. S37H4]|uniref:Uncharacterized protein n=1 Tax=Marivirga aurantiaca TaxID=2802615 RepID=A0A935C651_9BACT|nr:hypothetical protein [Marivirga aurantiaca]MBK6264174.1 hypothetical protein [Marivirga aurantiaca]